MACPAHEELIRHAFGEPAPARDPSVALHVQECASCFARGRAFRETASAFYRDPWTDATPSTECLNEGELAAAAEGIGGEERRRWFVHLAACDRCRSRFAGLKRLLRDAAIAAELERLDRPSLGASRRRSRRSYLGAAAALAAAVVGAVLLRPGAAPVPSALYEDANPPHRESAITTTIAPSILGPVGPAAAEDSLVWTSVPHADRYRIRVFERDGTLAWDEHSRDTTLAIPPHLGGADANAYLWRVEARTGWDRWVGSEWQEFSIRPATPPR